MGAASLFLGTSLALAVSSLAAGSCKAQKPMLSEHAVAAQTVAGTTITVEYYRPQARGRDSLFGKVVKWGEHWTPGANWATTIEVDHDVRLNGAAAPEGTLRGLGDRRAGSLDARAAPHLAQVPRPCAHRFRRRAAPARCSAGERSPDRHPHLRFSRRAAGGDDASLPLGDGGRAVRDRREGVISFECRSAHRKSAEYPIAAH